MEAARSVEAEVVVAIGIRTNNLGAKPAGALSAAGQGPDSAG